MVQIKVTDESCIGDARRAAIVFANELGFSENELGKIAIVVTELGTNLMKYASAKGEILLQPLKGYSHQGLEVLAIDNGPGIGNIRQALRDGYSTNNTSGTGLGAVMRLSHQFDIYSVPPIGTVVMSRFWSSPLPKKSADRLEISGICVAKLGQEVPGDAWATSSLKNHTLLLVADGLGHGPEAAAASQLACQVFKTKSHLPLVPLLSEIHTALRKTRGAAVAIAEIDSLQQAVRYVGLGNISGAIIVDNEVFHMMSHDGTAGLGQFKTHEFIYPWQQNALLIMHSDGLSRWDLSPYPGLTSRHPLLIASLLYRDFTRGNDDTTVVVAREKNSFSSQWQ